MSEIGENDGGVVPASGEGEPRSSARLVSSHAPPKTRDDPPTLVIRPRRPKRSPGESPDAERVVSSGELRELSPESPSPSAVVDEYGTIIFATPSASLFLSGSPDTILVGKTLDRFLVPLGSNESTSFASLLSSVDETAVGLRCARSGMEGTAELRITVERIRSVLRSESFLVALSSEPSPGEGLLPDVDFACARAIAEIGMALVDEADLEGFVRRSAKALRDAAEVEGLRVVTKYAAEESGPGGPPSNSEGTVVSLDGERGSSALRIEFPQCDLEVLGASPDPRAIQILECAGRRLSSALSKRWAEARLLALAARCTLLDTVSSELLRTELSATKRLHAVAAFLGRRADAGCLIMEASRPGVRSELKSIVTANRHDLLGALRRFVDEQSYTPCSDRSAALHEALRYAGLSPTSLDSAPIERNGEVIGTLHVVDLGTRVDRTAEDESFVRTVASRIGGALRESTLASSRG